MELPQAFINTLKGILGANEWLLDPADTWVYGYDNSRKHAPPDCVALPSQVAQIKPIVEACFLHEIPLTARGRASGTTGGSIPLKGGLVLSLERINSILDFDISNRFMVVESGVLNDTIQKKAATKGFFWGPDPSSAAYCTIGGNLACNAAGPRSIKYGTTRENTLGLKAVLGDGTELTAGVHTTKGVVGYDFTRLLIGSEGTLGIITEATVKLTPLPECIQTISAFYKDMDSCVQAIVDVMSQSVIPCALEIMDSQSVHIIRNHQKVDLPVQTQAILLLEVDGSKQSIAFEAESILKALSNPGLIESQLAKTQQESEKLWYYRKALSPALRSLSPHKINEDIVVPVSRLPELFTGIEQLSKQYEIPIVSFGHGGNGNIHVNLLADPLDPIKGPIAHEALNALFDLVVSLGGTLSGEHGVGIEKRDFVSKELQPNVLKLMHNLKKVFDPKGILNPGKMFPELD